MGKWARVLVAAAVIATGAVAAAPAQALAPPAAGGWVATGTPLAGGVHAYAELRKLFRLPDGGALSIVSTSVWQYRDPQWYDDRSLLVERWDPHSGGWSPVASPAVGDRIDAAVAQFGDGRVIVAGGRRGSEGLATTEVFDPATNLWSPGPPLDQPRIGLRAAGLPDGRVMVHGGLSSATGSRWLRTAVILDVAGTSTVTSPSLVEHGTGGQLVAMADGRVYLVTSHGSEVYDPLSDTWVMAAKPALGSCHDGCPIVALPDGRLLWADRLWRGSTHLLDPATLTWSPGPPLNAERDHGSAVLLSDGRVLVAGGRAVSGVAFGGESRLRTAEIFDPTDLASGWRPLAHSDSFNGALLAIDGGRALLVDTALRSAEMFDPTLAAPESSLTLVAPTHHLDRELRDTPDVRVQLIDPATEMTPMDVRILPTVTGANPHMGTEASCGDSCLTDSRGWVSYEYEAMRAGTDTVVLTADLDGDGAAGAGEPAATVTVTWRKAATKIVRSRDYIAANLFSGPSASAFVMEATLEGSSSRRGIAGVPLKFTLRSKVLCVAITDRYGKASCLALPPDPAGVALNGGYDIVFDGSDRDLPSRGRGRVLGDNAAPH